MKSSLISMLISLLKWFFTLKKMFLLAGFIGTAHYVKTKFFKSTSQKKCPQTSITPFTQSSFSKESKRELFLTLSTLKIPKDLIEKIFFISLID